jgi:ABC-type antimicrobial peptide transport system permease subunit
MVLVRTRGEPLALVPQVAAAVRRADPDLALFDVQTMDTRARGSWSKHTFQTNVFAVIAVIALALAVTGVFAVTAYFVARRNHEIGVRMALGASSFDIARSSMLPTVRLAIAGGALGLLGALALSRVMRAMLYETSPFDAGVFAGAAAVLALAVAAASYVPLRRAIRLNPVEVLRRY